VSDVVLSGWMDERMKDDDVDQIDFCVPSWLSVGFRSARVHSLWRSGWLFGLGEGARAS
jgi:hypothetical protein